jgi:hypothetical protein
VPSSALSIVLQPGIAQKDNLIMTNFSGSIIVNGITDKELVKILEIKMKHEGQFFFNPQQLQVTNVNRPGQPQESVYNNAVFTWGTEAGLDAVYQIMGYLLKKEERQQVA